MADYLSQHTGEQLDEAVQKVLNITSTPANIDAAVAQELETIDYVIDRGTNGDWRYKKFASGDAVLWGIHDVSPTTSTQTGSMYYTESLEVSTPFSLVDQVVINATPATHVCFATNVYYSVPRSAVGFRLVRNATFPSGGTVTVHLQVWGKWK